MGPDQSCETVDEPYFAEPPRQGTNARLRSNASRRNDAFRRSRSPCRGVCLLRASCGRHCSVQLFVCWCTIEFSAESFDRRGTPPLNVESPATEPRPQPGPGRIEQRLDRDNGDDAASAEIGGRPHDLLGPRGQRDHQELSAAEFELPLHASAPLALHQIKHDGRAARIDYTRCAPRDQSPRFRRTTHAGADHHIQVSRIGRHGNCTIEVFSHRACLVRAF